MCATVCSVKTILDYSSSERETNDHIEVSTKNALFFSDKNEMSLVSIKMQKREKEDYRAQCID